MAEGGELGLMGEVTNAYEEPWHHELVGNVLGAIAEPPPAPSNTSQPAQTPEPTEQQNQPPPSEEIKLPPPLTQPEPSKPLEPLKPMESEPPRDYSSAFKPIEPSGIVKPTMDLSLDIGSRK